MTREQANRLLDEVRCNKPHPDRHVDLALLTTGDLHAKLYHLDTYLHHRFAVEHSPSSPNAVPEN